MAIRDWWWEYVPRLEEQKDVQKPAKFRGPEWDEARRKHREKMKAKNGASSITSD